MLQTINDGTNQPGSLAGRILHAAHRKNQLHPACMVLHIPSMDTGELLERAADDMPVLQVRSHMPMHNTPDGLRVHLLSNIQSSAQLDISRPNTIKQH